MVRHNVVFLCYNKQNCSGFTLQLKRIAEKFPIKLGLTSISKRKKFVTICYYESLA